MNDAEIRERALALCAIRHPGAPCGEPCDHCWQTAQDSRIIGGVVAGGLIVPIPKADNEG